MLSPVQFSWMSRRRLTGSGTRDCCINCPALAYQMVMSSLSVPTLPVALSPHPYSTLNLSQKTFMQVFRKAAYLAHSCSTSTSMTFPSPTIHALICTQTTQPYQHKHLHFQRYVKGYRTPYLHSNHGSLDGESKSTLPNANCY